MQEIFHHSTRQQLAQRTYSSGLVNGESYEVTNRPYERINETFHTALQQIMLEVADDLRPLLVGQCRITDLPGPEA